VTPTPAAAPPPARPAPGASTRPGAPFPGTGPAGGVLATRAPGAVTTTGPATVAAPRPGRLSRTPARLRLAALVAVLACAVVAVSGLGVGLAQADALRSAGAATEQQVRTLDVRNDLVAADATATNAFLVGGREPVSQRERYDAWLASASGGLTAVAGADAGDAALLAPVSTSLAVYSGLVEQARANNRQGFPVGAAYLEAASQELRDGALPGLDDVVAATDSRVSSAFTTAGRAGLVLLLAGSALVVLVGVQVWLASRTHRRLNAGLVLSTIVLVAATFLLGASLDGGSRAAADVQDGAYADTVDLARAYSLANDAKAAESFTLIKRGSGQAYEEAYAANVEEATALLGRGSPDLRARFDAWTGTHAEIRALDDGGDWDGAVALATSTEADSPNDRFDAFAEAAQEETRAASGAVHADLERAARASQRSAWVALVAGVLAAAAALWGFSPRLKEYR